MAKLLAFWTDTLKVKILIKVELPLWKFEKVMFWVLCVQQIQSHKGLMLEMSASQIFHGGNLTFFNSFDKTKFSCVTLQLIV